MAKMRGGDGMKKVLEGISRHLGRGAKVRVGFLENATYPDGKPVAMIAFIQDGGAPAAGIPPRPFFRNMIAQKKSEWPDAIKTQLKQKNYNADATLRSVGEGVAGQLRQSIRDTNSPPLAESTIARKGFSKPLVDSGHMLNSVDYEVVKPE